MIHLPIASQKMAKQEITTFQLQEYQQQFSTILSAFPVELWHKTFKSLTPRNLLRLRLACPAFNSLVEDKVYQLYYLQLLRQQNMVI